MRLYFSLLALLTVFSLVVIKPTSIKARGEPIVVGVYKLEPAVHYLPFISAMENGYFKRKGLNVIVEHFNDTLVMTDALKEGEIDFALSYPLFPTIAQEYDFPIQILGVLTQGTAYYGYTNQSDLKMMADLNALKDKNIGLFPDTHSLTFHFMTLMRQNSNLFESVNADDIAPSDQHMMLTDGKIDLAIGTEPMLSQIINEQTLFRSFAFDQFLGKKSYIVLSANTDRIGRNPGIVENFTKALNNALIAFNTDPLIAVRVAQQAYPEYTYDQLKAPIKLLLDKETYPDSLYLSEELWDNTLPALIESGYLLERVPYKDVVNTDYTLGP